MEPRDDKILRHIGLYRVSLRYIIERLFFESGNSGNVLQRLMNQKRIQSRTDLRGSLAYYQLTLTEARSRCLPQDRGRAFGPRALTTHLAILWFCGLASAWRRRLEDAELHKTIGDIPSGAPHVAQAGSQPCIFRVHVISSQTRVADVMKRLRAEMCAAADSNTLYQWINAKRYGFALLTDNSSRAEALRGAVQRADLWQKARILCEHTPSPLNVQQVIHDLRKQPPP